MGNGVDVAASINKATTAKKPHPGVAIINVRDLEAKDAAGPPALSPFPFSIPPPPPPPLVQYLKSLPCRRRSDSRDDAAAQSLTAA
ncbi:unnamed protein product [Lampetra planeri]